MIKIIEITLFIAIIAIVAILLHSKYNTDNVLSVPEHIIHSVIIVESSSGIVIYQDSDMALVLTAAHVINNNLVTPPYIVKIFNHDKNGELDLIPYEVEDYSIDIKSDLAILKIPSLDYSVIPTEITLPDEDPGIGDEIYIASNPNFHYRSLKKGIVSAKNRKTNFGDSKNWEVDAMIIFGSSGGGAFNKDGKLFGIVSGISALKTDHCWGTMDLENNTTDEVQCLYIPISQIGYVVSPKNVRSFIYNSKFSNYFNLKRKD